jgi:excisionase family DNA binding protein
MGTDQQLYTVQEVANILKVHWQTVLNYIKRGKLKAVRMGKGYRITQQDLDTFIDENKTST